MSEQSQIRLLLLDDHGLFRVSLARFLALEPGFEIAGECGSPAEALELLSHSAVDIVLLDLDLGSEHGDEFIVAALQAGYKSRFLIVASTADTKSAAMGLKLGASGIFLKSEAPERLIHAIRVVANGEVWIDPRVIQMLAQQFTDRYPQSEDRGPSGVLKDRERTVLLGIIGGLTNRKIGANMGLSESSVKNIVQQLFSKAGVKTRSQLVRVALEGSLGTGRLLKSQQSKDNSFAELQQHSPNHSPIRQSDR